MTVIKIKNKSSSKSKKTNSERTDVDKDKSAKKIEVGGIKFTPLFEGLMPRISEEEYQRLRNDIKVNGVLVPIVCDEKRGIVDGINRLKAVSELRLRRSRSSMMKRLRPRRQLRILKYSSRWIEYRMRSKL